jgi:hypothetical protein
MGRFGGKGGAVTDVAPVSGEGIATDVATKLAPDVVAPAGSMAEEAALLAKGGSEVGHLIGPAADVLRVATDVAEVAPK